MTFANGSNTYIPELSTKLKVEYSRGDDWWINQFVTYHSVEEMAGAYPVIAFAESIREDIPGRPQSLWADASERPNNFRPEFSIAEYRCKRFSEGTTIGDLARKQSKWDLVETASRGLSDYMMHLRTTTVLNDLTNTSLMSGSTGTASSVGGGKWDAATSSTPYIQRTIQAVLKQMRRVTNRNVKASDLTLVVNEEGASQMAITSEIREYLSGSPFALDYLTGSENFAWGLPPKLYGVNVVVDGTDKVTSKKGKTDVYSSVLDDDAVFIARLGGSENNTLSGSNLLFFDGEELMVETFEDVRNRRIQVDVSDNYAHVVRTELAYLVQDIYD